jgi:predicted translin family RNA/ssDNA-binding protein
LQQAIVTQDDVRKTIFSTPVQEYTEERELPTSSTIQAQPSHSLHIALDKYAEAINEIMDIVRDLGRNSVSLDIQDEDLDVASEYSEGIHFVINCAMNLHYDVLISSLLGPSSAILSVGRTMVMNVKNPSPRR